jgi:hypothetical protein
MAEVKVDSTLRAAVDVARDALDGVAEAGSVGDHLEMVMDGDRVATHYFACLTPAYLGWRWAVSVSRAARQKVATVCETNLVPGATSVLSPQWLPYAERIAPGDLSAGDVLPYRADDPLLVQGFEATGSEDVDETAFWELGLGRRRVLSNEGREVAAQRWYDGSHGPTAEVAVQAPDRCSSCGYFVPMAGALRAVFGVCANAWSPSDGQVVSLDHGCGAHSESDVPPDDAAAHGRPIVDELAFDIVR